MKKINLFFLAIVSFSAFYGCDACFDCKPIHNVINLKVVNNKNEPLSNYPVLLLLQGSEEKQNTNAEGVLVTEFEIRPPGGFDFHDVFAIFADSSKNIRAYDCIILHRETDNYAKNTIIHTITADSLIPIKVRIKKSLPSNLTIATVSEGVGSSEWDHFRSRWDTDWLNVYHRDSIKTKTKLRYPLAQTLEERSFYNLLKDTTIVMKGFAKKPFIIKVGPSKKGSLDSIKITENMPRNQVFTFDF